MQLSSPNHFYLNRKTWALLALILVAAALRFYRLDAQDIWGDEAFSIFLSQQPLATVIAGGADTHPPLYPVVLLYWMQLVGSLAFATRALSAIIGTLVVPLIFVFAKRLTARPSIAFLSAILATVSPLLIYYSQETRMYEQVAVLMLASAYFFICHFSPQCGEKSSTLNTRFLVGKRRLFEMTTVGYLLVTLAAMYTHYSAFFALVAQNLFAFIYWRKNLKMLLRWIMLQAILAVAYIPWVIVQSSFLGGKASGRFDEWGWRGIEMIFGKTFLAFSAGVTMDAPLIQIVAIAFLIFAVLGSIAVLTTERTEDTENKKIRWFALLYFIVPVAIAYAVNPVMPFFYERYVLVALPGFIVLVAIGINFVARRQTMILVGVPVILVIANMFSLNQYYFNDVYAKGKYGQMMAYVARNAQPGDALVLNNPLQKPMYRYYAPRDIPAFFLPDGVPLEDPGSRAQLAEIARTHSRIWLVMFGNPLEYDPTSYLERWLGANAFKTFADGFVDASLSLYVMPNAASAIQRSTRATLGDSIQLVGYALDREQISPGQTLLLTLKWQTQSPIMNRYKVFTHVLGAINPATQSPVWAQMDSEPVGGSRPTTSWQPGETVEDRYGLLIPKDAPPGEYMLEIGIYDANTLARLPVRDEQGNRVADDNIILGTVRVVAR
jgi:hypothetical protein